LSIRRAVSGAIPPTESNQELATMSASTTRNQDLVNGLDVEALRAKAGAIAADPKLGRTRWNVTTRWTGGARSDTSVTECEIGGQRVQKDFTIRVDEPLELCGSNQFANPQELLLAALNACMTFGYVANFALQGIVLRELSIETGGEIDLRGFLGHDSVKPGYDELTCTVHVKADATPAQIELVHDIVCRTSPNLFNLSQPVRVRSRLVSN
jgi:uncharacterized OsmC-like protein